MKKDWVLENKSEEKSLIKRLLISRGITTDKEIKDFLNPLEMELTSPDVFTDMEKVTQRLCYAIDNNETTVIYGDFDADGVTSTSILYKTLKYLGGNVHYYIPNRETESHGLNNKALIKLMTTIKPKVLITVDCGISDIEQVKFINSFKVTDIIITDHHEAPEILPPAYGIINPKAQNSLSESLSAKQIEHLTYLAGCGVAFKVAQSILSHYDKTDFIYEILPFVAVGTISDVVPLLGENRYFVTKGLELISQGKHEGLTKLLESAGYHPENGVTAENIAFGVAPRINASGRLDTVDSALKVLISDNPHEIKMATEDLNELNKVRQTLCNEAFAQADEMLKKEGNKSPAIILFNSNWHIGIIGIVASKLVEKYYKPTFLMTKENNEYRCSARSVEGVPLYDVINENSALFDGFGGHKLAAGLMFNEEKTSFDTVKKALNETVGNYINNQDIKPFIKIDAKLNLEEITLDLIEELEKLEPYGASNPSPIFETDDFILKQKRLMGSDNSHLKLTLEKEGVEFTAVRWSQGDINLNVGDKLDLAFHPQKNEFNGNISVQLIIDDIHSDALKEEIQWPSKYKIFDNRLKQDILPNVNDYIKTTKLNVGIFAESKSIIDNLKQYPQIYSKIFSRTDIPKCDIVMFFDYPADRLTLDKILDKTGAKGLHFMYYEPKFYDEEEIITIFSGMTKFSAHNNNGKFDLIRCASYLGKSINFVKSMLNLYAQLEYIKISDKNNVFYTIEFIKPADKTDLFNSKDFSNILNIGHECEIFQKSLLEDDLTEIIL